MADVIAVNCIMTAQCGLVIAKKGDVGVAVKDAKPYDPQHVGKVLVRFGKRRRAYWCEARHLKFAKNVDTSHYIARLDKYDPFEQAPALPTSMVDPKYHFGNNLKLCRLARKMTQAELGEAMKQQGLRSAQATICFREAQPHSPNGKFIDAAAKALKVPAWVFFVDMMDSSVYSNARKFLNQLSSTVCEVEDVGFPRSLSR